MSETEEPAISIVVHPSDKDRIQAIVDFLRPDGGVEVITSTVPPPGTIYLFRAPKVEMPIIAPPLYPWQEDALESAVQHARSHDMYDGWVKSKYPVDPATGHLVDPGVS